MTTFSFTIAVALIATASLASAAVHVSAAGANADQQRQRSALSSVAAGGYRDQCDYTAATDRCDALITGAQCEYWKCIFIACPTTWAHETARSYCWKTSEEVQKTPVVAEVSALQMGHLDGDDRPNAPAPRVKSAEEQLAIKEASAAVAGPFADPIVHSPCTGAHAKWSRAKVQHFLHKVAMDGYKDRAKEHYSEGSNRWSGITGNVCPSSAPTYSDCSSFVTWIYWTLFGKGPDFMNGEQWSAGYTGTLDKHGRNVSEDSLQVGDLCFYYHPMHHVAIYVGGGKVVSHGMDPVGFYAWNYAPVDFCRRYI